LERERGRVSRFINLVWSKFDSLIILDGYSEEELIGYAVEEAALQSMSLNQALVCVVVWLDEQRCKRWGLSPGLTSSISRMVTFPREVHVWSMATTPACDADQDFGLVAAGRVHASARPLVPETVALSERG
jgi:hypothetical protein